MDSSRRVRIIPDCRNLSWRSESLWTPCGVSGIEALVVEIWFHRGTAQGGRNTGLVEGEGVSKVAGAAGAGREAAIAIRTESLRSEVTDAATSPERAGRPGAFGLFESSTRRPGPTPTAFPPPVPFPSPLRWCRGRWWWRRLTENSPGKPWRRAHRRRGWRQNGAGFNGSRASQYLAAGL